MIVRALTSGTVLTVKRNAFGSTNTSHASGNAVLINPRFFNVEIVDAINNGFDNTFPLIYKPVTAEFTGLTASTYEYAIPNMNSPVIPIQYINQLMVKDSGDFAYREFKSWEISRGTTPTIILRRPLAAGGSLRIEGYGPFPHLSALTDTTDALWPFRADALPVYWAVSELLMSGEALRVRTDTGAIDSREQANRPGSSSAAASAMLQRFYTMLRQLAMPPLPKNVKSIL